MLRKKHVLFISHDASLSGAPILLLHLMRLLKSNDVCRFMIVVKRGGVLERQFADLQKTIVLKPVHYLKGNVFKKASDVLLSKLKLLQTLYIGYRADVVFSNTITNGQLLRLLAFTGTPVVSYIHELRFAAQFFDLLQNSSLTISRSALFLFPSAAVSAFLSGQYGIPNEKKRYLPYFFPDHSKYSNAERSRARALFSEKYQLDTTRLWVVNMGTVSHRKGIDYFLEVAEMARIAQKKITFIWIGEYEKQELKSYVTGIIDPMQEKNVLFVGAMPNHPANLLPFDLFFLSSREDPYPLVVIEAAYLAIPSICFEGSGGIPEFVENDAGWIIPEFSTSNATACITEIEKDRSLLHAKGQQAMIKAIQRHSNATMVIDMFRQALDVCVS